MQYNTVGVYVSRDQLQPGDLVFFDGLGHMGMYIGGGQFIHAPHTGDVVKISSLYDSWYASTYVGAKRVTCSSLREPRIGARWHTSASVASAAARTPGCCRSSR